MDENKKGKVKIDWMELITKRVWYRKHIKKHTVSVYRNDKLYPHKTINGKGLVARLYNKKGE